MSSKIFKKCAELKIQHTSSPAESTDVKFDTKHQLIKSVQNELLNFSIINILKVSGRMFYHEAQSTEHSFSSTTYCVTLLNPYKYKITFYGKDTIATVSHQVN